ncbi:MAG: nickel pincer cofactor biosynthesis protein LarB [Actinobacteria bacterium]|nr:nickel pincer cofactor biosynthesis protein LarB [Actinomycetota bacterium]
MVESEIMSLLTAVQAKKMSVEEAVLRLSTLSFVDLGFAKVDHDRAIRLGFPEVIYCEGKTPVQIERIAGEVLEGAETLLATRADQDAYEAVRRVAPDASYREEARVVTVDRRPEKIKVGSVVIACAGTADLPVAEEAASTAKLMGARITRLVDVGVAGIHRLLAFREELQGARAIVAVAGMDGVLPSVIGGLVSAPVIAVPTSVGYGASLGGLAALLTMLNSCAPGVAVVNIDNGFGAGYLAATINSLGEERNREAYAKK